MKKLICFLLTGCVVTLCTFAQVTIGSNNPPDASAVLDLQSSTAGFLPPRLTTVQRNAIQNPAAGLTIYNTDTDCIETYFFSGTWKQVQCGCNAFPNANFTVSQGTVNQAIAIGTIVPNMIYNWSFQNGSPANSGAASNQVTWSAAGTYGVTLTLTDSAGCSASFTDSITIINCSPFTLNFTNCGQTGKNGPSQMQCNSTYGPGVVTVSGGIQQWVVPTTGTYRILAAGAQGGNEVSNAGGLGALMQGDFQLNQGDVLHILVGQRITTLPSSSSRRSAGGGGGSYVALSGNTLLLAAGGGGGASSLMHGGAAANTAANGSAGQDGSGTGGINGGGGTQGSSSGGAGGAGWLANGANGNDGNTGGLRFANGGLGGDPYFSTGTNFGTEGGFGGGGGGWAGGGGGGGYSGGGGGRWSGDTSSGAGGGGGSFNSGANPVNQGGANAGQGYVTIIFTCP